MMERFGIQEVYGMHNMPGLPVGDFAIRPGPIMAASDDFTIEITGRGGHAAQPHNAIDPVVAGSQIVMALQTIVSRNADPLKSGRRLGHDVPRPRATPPTSSPSASKLRGTARTLDPEVRDLIEARMRAIVDGDRRRARRRGRARPTTATTRSPSTPRPQTDFAARVAADVVGAAGSTPTAPPVMGGEDFSFMLNARPGAFIFVGNGDTAKLHHPKYDFNDELIPVGCSYWARLVETAMPAA